MTEVIEVAEFTETGTELVPVTAPLPISFVDDPEAFLEEAASQAKVLKSFLEKTDSVVKIGPSEHVKVGGWQFLAQQAGLSTGTTAEPITLEDGDSGFKGHAIVYRAGQKMGEGEALCLRSERNWKNSDTYALYSMAQTRAISKAIKGVLGFVVVMAGYSDTPAEEMPRDAKRRAASAPRNDEPKAQRMREKIMKLAGEADTARGEEKTLGEVEAAAKTTWDKQLADLSEGQLSILGTDLKAWLEAGASKPFTLVPF